MYIFTICPRKIRCIAMKKIVIEQNSEKNDVSIDNLEFLSKADLTILQKYTDFVYDIAFYIGNNIVCTCQRSIDITVVEPHKIRVMFRGFENKTYSRAVISSITAFKDNEKLTIMLAHEITYSFHN